MDVANRKPGLGLGLWLAAAAIGAPTAPAWAAVDFPPLRDPYLADGAPPHRCERVPRAEREKLGFPLTCPGTAASQGNSAGGSPPPPPPADTTANDSRSGQQIARRTPPSSGGGGDRFVQFLTDGRESMVPEVRHLAEQGDVSAALAYGSSLFSGRAVEPDQAGGRQWLEQAAQNGSVAAQRWLGVANLKGTLGRRDMEAADRHLRAAARSDDGQALYYLGVMAEKGMRGKRDVYAAVDLYERAAAAGLPYAQMRLGQMYDAGHGVDKNVTRAVELFKAAAEAGYGPAQTAYAHHLFKGVGVLQDYGRAWKWYQRGAGTGDAAALNMIGYMLAQGVAVKQDTQKAANKFLKAAVRGDPSGQYNLAMLLQNGKEGSRITAHALFNLAAAKGHGASPRAREALERRMSQEAILKAQSRAARWRDTWTVEELKHISSGTGFVINFGGGVVTNHHVVDGCDRLGVRLRDEVVPAKLVFASADVDVALIQMSLPNKGKRSYGVGQLAGWSEYFVGEEVTIYGFPLTQFLDKGGVLTIGTLNALSGWRGQNDDRFLQISAPVQSGNSGSAVVDEKGAIIGVVWGGLNTKKITNQNVNFAAKHTVLRELLNRYGITYYETKAEGGDKLSRKERYAVAKNMTRQIICYAFDMNKLFKKR